jgi:hypothetical protein
VRHDLNEIGNAKKPFEHGAIPGKYSGHWAMPGKYSGIGQCQENIRALGNVRKIFGHCLGFSKHHLSGFVSTSLSGTFAQFNSWKSHSLCTRLRLLRAGGWGWRVSGVNLNWGIWGLF